MGCLAVVVILVVAWFVFGWPGLVVVLLAAILLALLKR